MKKMIKSHVFVLLICLMLCELSALAQEVQVRLLEPDRDGFQVQQTYTVRGTAVLPPGAHLWVLSRREDFEGVWWPQGEGRPDATTGEWKVAVTFGQSVDVGWKFNISVLVVSEANHIILRDYRLKAMKTGDWRPIEAPASLFNPVLRTVTKTGH